MNIKNIIDNKDTTSAMIELIEILNKKSNFGEYLSLLTPPEKTLYYLLVFEAEVNNGGFNQFYWNLTGNYAHETVESLMEIGASNLAEILHKANSVWPNGKVPKDRQIRQDRMDEIEEEIENVWEECDAEFYKYPDNLEALIIQYVRKKYQTSN